jgi:hypothetical protein
VELQDRWRFSINEDVDRRCASDAHRPPIEDEKIIYHASVYIKTTWYGCTHVNNRKHLIA